jgi:hypothetical protein
MNTKNQVHDDFSPRANLMIWVSFFLLVVFLYVSIVSLIAYFRYEVEEEKYLKVDSVVPRELKELRQNEAQVLNGEISLLGKKSISIEQAMDQMIKANFRASREQ